RSSTKKSRRKRSARPATARPPTSRKKPIAKSDSRLAPLRKLLLQHVEEGRLRRVDLHARHLQIEKPCAIHLREALLSSRTRRPLHLEEVAPERRRIAVALERPGVHPLSAFQPNATERKVRALAREARFLGEFATCAGERVLALVDAAFG